VPSTLGPVAAAAAPVVPVGVAAPKASIPSANPLTQEQFDMMVARLWVECSLAFVLLDSAVVRAFFAKLVRHLRLPSRAKVTNGLLPLVHAVIEADAVELIKRQRTVTVTTDIYTDVNKSSIIDFLVSAPGMRSLY
jgi:hypothetical protein